MKRDINADERENQIVAVWAVGEEQAGVERKVRCDVELGSGYRRGGPSVAYSQFQVASIPPCRHRHQHQHQLSLLTIAPILRMRK